MKKAEKIYRGFRWYVRDKDLDKYDAEFHSRTIHTYRFMIPYIKRYVDAEWELHNTLDREEEKFIADYLNNYCKQHTELLKRLKEASSTPRFIDQKFLFH